MRPRSKPRWPRQRKLRPWKTPRSNCRQDRPGHGATRGIGRAIAQERRARRGCRRYRHVGIRRCRHHRGAAPFGGRGVVLDVTNAEACDALIDALGKEGGGPHILVNNAGITRDTLAMRMKDDDWSAVIDTNLASVFRLSRACCAT
nr:SDR family NAD(P)-dependent oxidoreductase [Achromobacter xylosoxidans]